MAGGGGKEGERQVKILIVDDNEDLREALSTVLRDEGYNVIPAQDGFEAIARVKEDGFAIIFMDVLLPKMNGVEAYKAIKKIDPTAVTVMMTGFSVPALVQEAMKEGAYAILYKPFPVDEMLNMIKKIRKSPSFARNVVLASEGSAKIKMPRPDAESGRGASPVDSIS